MRFTGERVVHLATLFIVLLSPLVTSWFVSSLIVLALVLSTLIIRFKARFLSRRITKPRLESITYSHYVERVRWCLDRMGIDYEEEMSIGILGLLLHTRTVPTLHYDTTNVHIGDSGAILRYLYGSSVGVRADEEIAFLKPSPLALEYEAKFDRILGQHGRRWMYHYLLQDENNTLHAWGAFEEKIPGWQRQLLTTFRPALSFILKKMLRVTKAGAEQSFVKVKALFEELDQELEKRSTKFLLGDELSFVDITLASLASLVLFPPNYTGGAASLPLPDPESWTSPKLEPFRRGVEELRATVTGQYIMDLYRNHRISGLQQN